MTQELIRLALKEIIAYEAWQAGSDRQDLLSSGVGVCVCVVDVSNVYPVQLAQFLRDKKTNCNALYISIHHGIVSATSVSLAGQDLSLTHITCSIEHSQIFVKPLRLAPLLTD